MKPWVFFIVHLFFLLLLHLLAVFAPCLLTFGSRHTVCVQMLARRRLLPPPGSCIVCCVYFLRPDRSVLKYISIGSFEAGGEQVCTYIQDCWDKWKVGENWREKGVKKRNKRIEKNTTRCTLYRIDDAEIFGTGVVATSLICRVLRFRAFNQKTHMFSDFFHFLRSRHVLMSFIISPSQTQVH